MGFLMRTGVTAGAAQRCGADAACAAECKKKQTYCDAMVHKSKLPAHKKQQMLASCHAGRDACYNAYKK